MVFVEIASKRTEQQDILKQLLLEARGSDQSNGDVRGHLIQLFSEAQDADEGDAREMKNCGWYCCLNNCLWSFRGLTKWHFLKPKK